MSQTKHIHFPLSLLRILATHPTQTPKEMSQNPENRQWFAQRLITFGYVRFAVHRWNKLCTWSEEMFSCSRDDAEACLYHMMNDEVTEFTRDSGMPPFARSLHESGMASWKAFGFVLNGSDGTPMQVGSAEWDRKWERDLQWYEQTMAEVPEKDAVVQIHIGLVWDLNDGKWNWDLFATYSALLSVILSKHVPWRITYEHLLARANGFKKVSDMPPDYPSIMTTRQLRTRITTLRLKNLVDTYSKPGGTRMRFYWLPWKVSATTAILYLESYYQKRAARKQIEVRLPTPAVKEIPREEVRELDW